MPPSIDSVSYLVLPERPAGTEGWSQEELAAIVNPRLHGRRGPPEGGVAKTLIDRRQFVADEGLPRTAHPVVSAFVQN